MDCILLGSFALLFFFFFLSSLHLPVYVCLCDTANEPRLFTSFRIHENSTLIQTERHTHTYNEIIGIRLLERRACTNCGWLVCACDLYIQKANTRATSEVATTKETMTRHSVRTERRERCRRLFIYLYIHAAAHCMFSRIFDLSILGSKVSVLTSCIVAFVCRRAI